MKVEMRLEGLDEVRRRLAPLPEATEARIVGGSLRQGGQVLRAEMARQIPRSDRPHGFRPAKSGAGGAKGRHGQMGASHAADHIGVELGFSKYSLAVGPAPDWWYTRFVELGTVHQRPQGKVRASVDVRGPEALRAVETALWAGIVKAER